MPIVNVESASSLTRALQSTPTTLSVTFDSDGAATDPAPDTATVTITRADGTVVVAGAAATSSGVGSFTYPLTAAQTAALDTLTATWTSTTLGTLTTTTEVVGGFLFSIAQARARPPLSDSATYPLEQLLAARLFAEQELEEACGVAFVPRYALESISGRARRALRLGHRRVRNVRSLTIDGVAMSPSYVAGLAIDSGQLLFVDRYAMTAWPTCSRIVIGYEHGYDRPPIGAGLAALDLARDRLISDQGSSTIDPRAERIITDDGEIRLRPGNPGRFGIASVDKFVLAHREALVA